MASATTEYVRRATVMLENPAMTAHDLMMLLTQRVNYELLSPDDEPHDLLGELTGVPTLRTTIMHLVHDSIERKWFEDQIAMPGGSIHREMYLYELLRIAAHTKPEGKLLDALKALKVRHPDILDKCIKYNKTLMQWRDYAIASSPKLARPLTA